MIKEMVLMIKEMMSVLNLEIQPATDVITFNIHFLGQHLWTPHLKQTISLQPQKVLEIFFLDHIGDIRDDAWQLKSEVLGLMQIELSSVGKMVFYNKSLMFEYD